MQASLFDEPQPEQCQHENVENVRPPHSGFKPGEMTRQCRDCWHWVTADNKAPALGE